MQTFKQIIAFFNERDKIGIKPGLNRVRYLLEEVNQPENEINGIHFAGTNGKGSTIEMVQSVLIKQDYRVGTFTSPSFIGIQGYFLINGVPITEANLIHLLNELMPHIERLDERDEHPTSFEILTVLAFMYFKDNTDIVLIETGMGGRHDTTNCFVPLVSVITSIAYDHMEFLGSSIEEIASQKAGIIKEKRPLVLGKVSDKARQVIIQEADALHASTYVFQEQYHLEQLDLRIEGLHKPIDMTDLSLKGQHQLENAAVAVMTLYVLHTLHFPINLEKAVAAVKSTTLPGRLEVIQEEPKIILDSAHNLAGMEALKVAIEDMNLKEEKELLFAGFYDKQLSEMLTTISPLFNRVILTTFEHERAATKTMLEALEYDQYTPHWKSYLDNLIEHPSNKTYFITGSLHFIMIVRQYLIEKQTYKHC